MRLFRGLLRRWGGRPTHPTLTKTEIDEIVTAIWTEGPVPEHVYYKGQWHHLGEKHEDHYPAN